LKQYDKTLVDYQTVLDQYINHESANDALIGLQETLNLLGRSPEFDRYFAQYKTANPDNSSLVNIEYGAAVNLYLSEDYPEAIQKFQDFINSYPGHNLVYEARFYIGESYYREGNEQQAIEQYQQVVEDNRISQMNRAWRRLGDLWFEQGQYAKAIQAYLQLEEAAQTKKENYYAWSGLMESYFLEADYELADQYASRILDQGGVSANAVNRSLLIRGKAAYQQDDFQTATDHFLSTLNTAQDENGAEAQYMMAKIQYEQGQYKQSNETLYDLNNRFGAYGYWLGKSFLLVTDNYISLDEIFQAKATLKSIIENAPEQEIVEEAKLKLQALEAQEPEEVISVDSVEIEVIEN
jgi:TolA-binding protein